MKKALIFTWIFRLALAGLYLMMALPKFGGAELTVHIFSTLGVEPWGRYFTGIIEILVFVLLLIPATTLYGAILSLGTIVGALLAHFFVIGIVIKNASGTINDGGEVFITAIIILALTLINLYLNRNAVPSLKQPQVA